MFWGHHFLALFFGHFYPPSKGLKIGTSPLDQFAFFKQICIYGNIHAFFNKQLRILVSTRVAYIFMKNEYWSCFYPIFAKNHKICCLSLKNGKKTVLGLLNFGKISSTVAYIKELLIKETCTMKWSCNWYDDYYWSTEAVSVCHSCSLLWENGLKLCVLRREKNI